MTAVTAARNCALPDNATGLRTRALRIRFCGKRLHHQAFGGDSYQGGHHDGSMPDGIAVSMGDQAGANLVGDFCIKGDISGFLAASHLSRIKVAPGVSINVKKPVNIQYFAMSYTNSLIDFGDGVQFKNSEFISGGQYRAYWNGIINANGLVLPGNIQGHAAFGGQAY